MMIYDMVASGKRLKALRKQAGKTQEQVAEAVGLEPGTISRIERGVKGMAIDSLLMSLSSFLRLAVSDGICRFHAAYPDRETPKYFNILETETRRPAFLAFSALTVTSR